MKVSIQPKPKKGLEVCHHREIPLLNFVSIQPKPKKGLEGSSITNTLCRAGGFNPAEAEEGFRRVIVDSVDKYRILVSIQPKPKKGLEVY